MLSMVPFHAFHKHLEEEHGIALQSKNKEHSCELEALTCQKVFTQNNCEHKTHLAKPIEKCFSCQFHFVKNYIHSPLFEFKTNSFYHQTSFENINLKELTFSQFITNKGPPSLA